MAYPERLSEALRREVYSFILSIYEASGSVHQPGVLIKDIESGANKILVAAAKYPLAELKDKTIKDILSELKGLRALFGVARDMGLLNHERIRSVWSECTELEEEFSKILAGSGERPADSQIRADNSSKRAEKGINEAGDTSKTKGEASSKKEKIFKGSTAGERGQQPPITHHPSPAGRERQDASLRQTAILEVLRRRPRVTVGELGALFSGRVSKKTLQRDLQDLSDRDVVKRTGERRWTAYSLNA